MAIEIITDRPGCTLRQFAEEDARPLFDLIDCNRPHLSQYLDKTAAKYPDYNSVLDSITNPPEPRKLRFGIWCNDQLVGTVNLKPSGQIAEIGYWIGREFTRQGYAALATVALCNWANANLQLSRIVAFVHKDNSASQAVLHQCGFDYKGKWPKSETAVWFSKRLAISATQKLGGFF